MTRIVDHLQNCRSCKGMDAAMNPAATGESEGGYLGRAWDPIETVEWELIETDENLTSGIFCSRLSVL